MDSGTPTEEILKVASIMESGVGLLLKELNDTDSIGKYEWEVEGRVLLWSLIRHFEAIYALMRSDTRLFPAANTLARSCLEISTRIKWILAPKAEFARESRFLTHLKEEVKYLRELSVLVETDRPNSGFQAQADEIEKFHDDVFALLPKSTKLTHNVPSVRDMMKQLGNEERYIAYRILSQTTHGTHAGGRSFRRGLGVAKTLKEPEQSNWQYIILTTWMEFCECGDRILECSGHGADRSIFSELDLELRTIAQRLKGH